MKKTARILGAVLTPALIVFVSACGSPGHPEKAGGIVGGIGLAQIAVYEQRPGPDGLHSGAPVIHAVLDEGFYVMSGSGRIELHDVHRGFRTINLSPGRYVQVPPCTLYRLVSSDHLTVFSLTAAEADDTRIYFGKDVDVDPAEYARLSGLAAAEGLEGALKRRDEAVRAYSLFLSLWKIDKPTYYVEIERFVGFQLDAAGPKRAALGKAVAGGPAAWAARYQARVKDLPLNRDELSPVFRFPPDTETPGASGMCLSVSNLEEIN
jgi:mannose-6-phosphate isomerase-like protein (cupin superfamily)